MKLSFILYYTILASCAAMPDEVSVGGFSSRYDFLGANSLKGEGNETGDEQGMMLTATYKLKPQVIRLAEPLRITNQQAAPNQSRQHIADQPQDVVAGPEAMNDLLSNITNKALSKTDIDDALVNAAPAINTKDSNLCYYLLTVIGTMTSCFGIRKLLDKINNNKIKAYLIEDNK